MHDIFLTEALYPDAQTELAQRAHITVATNPTETTVVVEALHSSAMLVRSFKVSPALLERLPKLKVLAKHGIGLDNIPVTKATELGIVVVNAPLSNVNAVAEQALTLLLTLFRRTLESHAMVREGRFSARNSLVQRELPGAVLGLVGMGRIARLFGHKAQALGMTVIGHDPFVPEGEWPEDVQRMPTLDNLLAQADAVSLHVPLTPHTTGLINADNLKQCKPGAVIINTCRGGVADEAALVDALRSGQLAGLGTDVYAKEPPATDHPLFSLPGVVLTPHNAALTHQALLNMPRDAADGILAVLDGRRPSFLVNPEVLGHSRAGI